MSEMMTLQITLQTCLSAARFHISWSSSDTGLFVKTPAKVELEDL